MPRPAGLRSRPPQPPARRPCFGRVLRAERCGDRPSREPTLQGRAAGGKPAAPGSSKGQRAGHGVQPVSTGPSGRCAGVGIRAAPLSLQSKALACKCCSGPGLRRALTVGRQLVLAGATHGVPVWSRCGSPPGAASRRCAASARLGPGSPSRGLWPRRRCALPAPLAPTLPRHGWP